jgi:hypothetical protein
MCDEHIAEFTVGALFNTPQEGKHLALYLSGARYTMPLHQYVISTQAWVLLPPMAPEWKAVSLPFPFLSMS